MLFACINHIIQGAIKIKLTHLRLTDLSRFSVYSRLVFIFALSYASILACLVGNGMFVLLPSENAYLSTDVIIVTDKNNENVQEFRKLFTSLLKIIIFVDTFSRIYG